MLSDEIAGENDAADGDWRASFFRAAFFRAAVPVVATYACTAVGVAWYGNDWGERFSQLVPPLVGLPVLLLFIVVLQARLLTILDWKARDQWVAQAEESPT